MNVVGMIVIGVQWGEGPSYAGTVSVERPGRGGHGL